ncbi:MAG: Phosphoglycerate mutase [Acidobacteria bacterium]|nr:Phosphoglycerate mutase [Acidobacteriota bacterium]
MTAILLIRHGLTDAINQYVAGTGEGTPLNAEGRAQVARLSARLRDVRMTAVLSSPLIRTRETAEAIAQVHHLPVEIVAGLTEFEFGEWTGRPFRELDADPEWQRFNRVRGLTRPPGGELMLDVQQRAVTALLEAAATYPGGRVVVVSHADVIRAALMYFLGIPLDLVHRLEIAPASVSIVTIDPNGAVVRRVNGDNADEAR